MIQICKTKLDTFFRVLKENLESENDIKYKLTLKLEFSTWSVLGELNVKFVSLHRTVLDNVCATTDALCFDFCLQRRGSESRATHLYLLILCFHQFKPASFTFECCRKSLFHYKISYLW